MATSLERANCVQPQCSFSAASSLPTVYLPAAVPSTAVSNSAVLCRHHAQFQFMVVLFWKCEVPAKNVTMCGPPHMRDCQIAQFSPATAAWQLQIFINFTRSFTAQCSVALAGGPQHTAPHARTGHSHPLDGSNHWLRYELLIVVGAPRHFAPSTPCRAAIGHALRPDVLRSKAGVVASLSFGSVCTAGTPQMDG